MSGSSLLLKVSVAGLVCLNGAAAYWLWSVWNVSLKDLPLPATESEAQPHKTTQRALDASAPRPLEAYDQIFMRPLFYKSRQPWESATPPTPPPPPPEPELHSDQPLSYEEASPSSPDFKLAGVIIAPRVHKVFVTSPNDAEGQWVGRGETIDGWTLTHVSSVSATFKRGKESVKISLYPDDSQKKKGPKPNE